MGLVGEKSQKAMHRLPSHLPAAHRQPVDQGMAGEGAGHQALTLNSISRAPQSEVDSSSGSSPWKRR